VKPDSAHTIVIVTPEAEARGYLEPRRFEASLGNIIRPQLKKN
jgi:hypothetical protein